MAGPWEAYNDQGQEGQSGPWQAYGGEAQPQPANVIPGKSVKERIHDFIVAHLPLQESVTGHALGKIKEASRASMDLTTSDPSLYKFGQSAPIDEAAGTMLENAQLGASVPRGLNTIGGAVAPKAVAPAEALAAQNALKSRTPLPPKAPTAPELLTEAQTRGYDPAEAQAAARPVHPKFRDLTVEDWKNQLRADVGAREATNPKTFGFLKDLSDVKNPDLGDFMNLRTNLRSSGEVAARKLEPLVNDHMESLSSGLTDLIGAADKNWNAGSILGRFGEGAERKQMQRAGQVGDRLTDLAKEQLFNKDSKYLTPEAERALEKLGTRTNYENIMHNVGRVGGALHWSMAGLGSFLHPATMAVPAAGSIARHLYNRSVLQRAGDTAQNLVTSSPLHQSRQAAYQAALASHLAGKRSESEVAAAMGILARPVASSPATGGVMPTPQQLVPY